MHIFWSSSFLSFKFKQYELILTLVGFRQNLNQSVEHAQIKFVATKNYP